MDEDTIDKTVELLRLMLMAQLISITGMIWGVEADRSVWDVLFHCRYGTEKHEVRSAPFSLGDTEKYLEDQMKSIAWGIAKAYWKSMIHLADLFEENKE